MKCKLRCMACGAKVGAAEVPERVVVVVALLELDPVVPVRFDTTLEADPIWSGGGVDRR